MRAEGRSVFRGADHAAHVAERDIVFIGIRRRERANLFGIVIRFIARRHILSIGAKQTSVLRIEMVDAGFLLRIRADIGMCAAVCVNRAQHIEIAKAVESVRRHDIRAFAVFVPGGQPKQVMRPIGGIRIARQIRVAHPFVRLLVVGHCHERMAFARPPHVVEADADGRDDINIFRRASV